MQSYAHSVNADVLMFNPYMVLIVQWKCAHQGIDDIGKRSFLMWSDSSLISNLNTNTIQAFIDVDRLQRQNNVVLLLHQA